VVCDASVVHSGSRVATAEGRIYAEGTGKLIAHGTTTCIVLSTNGNQTAAPELATTR
jgi:acyl-coenzyme A thioesterase PaaI-like protein